MSNLLDLLKDQLRLNRRRNPLHRAAESLFEVDPTFLSAMEELAASPEACLSPSEVQELARHAADLFIRRIYEVNQYLDVDSKARAKLERIYVDTWQEILRSGAVEETLRTHHYPRIRELIESLYPGSLVEALRSAPLLGEVPCSQYSARLQMELLRLRPDGLREPLLDIGCGARATLVTHLRSAGVEAYGVDRRIETQAPFLRELDWFDYELESGSWGTVVSHLSFSNHFQYIRRYRRESVSRYLDLYRAILGALEIGGSFVYAPGDDLLERQVDKASHRVDDWPVPAGYRATRVTRTAV